MYPNKCVKQKSFSTLLPPLYSEEMLHHMCDSGESIHSSVCHTIYMTNPLICQSHDSCVCHTIIMTSLSICQSHDSYVCHTIIMTSLSICLLHDLSVCQPKHDSAWNSVCLSVCLLSVPSVLPSARFMVKMPMSIPVRSFPKHKNLGKLLSICTSMDLSVKPSGSLSVTLLPSCIINQVFG